MAWISESRLQALDRDYRTWSPSRIADYQLARINELWDQASRSIPYYRRLVENGLPRRFASLPQYIATAPPLTREILQNTDVPCWSRNPRPDSRRVTGGTTARRLQVPAWRREYDENRLDAWLGRSWYGVSPRHRLMLYWGHGRELGAGWRDTVNRWRRSVKDRIQNYRRHSGFDMSEAALEQAGRRLLEDGAHFVLGYACYLDRLARANAHLSSAYAALGLKVVIGGAEAFPFEDSEARIGEVFHAPVGMEYGSEETGRVAHTHPDGGYRVFWRSHLLEYHPGSERQDVFVTCLFPRCTPLFRYRLHDAYEVSGESRRAAGCSTLSFARVTGRSNRTIRLPNGRRLHPQAVLYVIQGLSGVNGYQAVCRQDQVTLNVTVSRPLAEADVERARAAARQVDPQFGALLTVREVAELERTAAGKTPLILVRDGSDDGGPGVGSAEGAGGVDSASARVGG